MTAAQQAIQTYQQQKAAAETAYRQNNRPTVYFRDHIAAAETLLQTLWQIHFPDSNDISLIAIGGFGRCELYPHSDWDLAIISSTPFSDGLQQQTAQFIQTLWDARLNPAIKSGSIEEILQSTQNDITGETAFLEARHLQGNADLTAQLLNKLNTRRDTAAFIEAKLLEMEQRHTKSQGTGAQLEPNIKTCPGGLRDIHTLIWTAKAQGIDSNPTALVTAGVLTRTEAGMLAHGYRRLANIRIYLHLTADSPEDRLLFDYQSQVAESLGYTQPDIRGRSEALMHTFYRATKAIKQLNGILIPVLKNHQTSSRPQHIHPIDSHYKRIGHQIAANDLALFEQNPEHIFTIIQTMQEQNITTIEPQTLRAWWASTRKINARFTQNPENRRRFIQFFKHGTGLTQTLRFLNLYGVLGRYLPAWEKITGLLQHDLFHIYPVDDHILTVVRNMRRLAIETHSHEMPEASAIMQAYPRPHVLYTAALLHDIAKGRGGDHAKEGIKDAQQFAANHYYTEEESHLLAWLVENHLLMSTVAQKEDIQDPHVLQAFCRRIPTREYLDALYLLTIADIRGTNPKLWNTWRASLLQTLYHSTAAVLNSKHHDPERLPNRREQASTDQLTRAAVPLKNQQKLRRILGSAYYVRHQTREILWHTANLAYDTQSPAVRSRILPQSNSLQVMVFMPNGDRLFARLCRIFSSHRFDIQAARAFITEHDYILDTFILQLPDNLPPEEYPDRQSALEAELNSFIHGNTTVQKQSGRPHISRRIRHIPIPPTVIITPEEDYPGWHTIDITAVNRPHLLADIAETFFAHNISLRYAKITTLDQRIEDSFITYSPSLQDPQTQNTLKQALIEVLAP